jgi:hypothetical protein
MDARRGQRLQPDLRFALLAGGLGLAIFALSWLAVRWLAAAGTWGPPIEADDVDLYRTYAGRWLDGLVPYRDFRVEYPPLALPILEVPALLSRGGRYMAEYRAAFQMLMLATGLVMTGYVVLTAWRLGAGRARLLVVAAATGALPLLIGPVIQGRYDLVPAALTIAGLAALTVDRSRLAAVLIGLAIMAKLYPIVVVPLVAIHLWRRDGRRAAIVFVALVAVTCAAILGPFFALAAGGTMASMANLATRPLEVETLGAALLFVLQSLGVLRVHIGTVANSLTLHGSPTAAVLVLQSAVLVTLLGAVYLRFVRSGADREDLVVASAASVAIFVAFGKILSPQYLIWLVPLVAVVGGRRGLAAMAVLGAGLVLTSTYFPGRFNEYIAGEGLVAWIVLARDLALVALVGVLIAPRGWFREVASGAVESPVG